MAAGDETYASGTVPKIHDTERVLLVKLILAEGGGSGGGGGGDIDLIQGHYGGVAPGVSPTNSPVIAKDLDAPFPWWWWDGSAWS